MIAGPRRIVRWSAGLTCVLALVALAPAAALARGEVLRWSHPDPSQVAGFTVHVGLSSGSYNQAIPVGKPLASGGDFSTTITVPDSDSVYVAVSATGTNGLRSVLSNEQYRPAPATTPPPSTPLGAPGTPVVVP